MSLYCAISNTLQGKQTYCCFCFKTIEENMICVRDVIALKGIHNPVKMTEILEFVLGKEILQTVSPNSAVCQQCKVLSVNSYTFIKMCKENSERFNSAIDTLTNCLQNTVLFDSKSMFVILNTNNFTNQIYYDYKKPVHSQSTAFRRLQSLINIKQNDCTDFEPEFYVTPKVESDTATEKPNVEYDTATGNHDFKLKKKVKKYTSSKSIATSDMMYDKNSYKCKECLKVFRNGQNLRQHYFRVHAPKEFKCPDCPRSYGNKSILQQHIYDSHCTVVCSECGKTYSNRYSLKIHELGHKAKLVCQACGRTYKHKITFAKHIQNNQCQRKEKRSNSQATFTCDYCNKKFSHKPTLGVHIQFEHGNAKAYICKWCNKRFNAQSRLKAHMVKHTQEKKFECDECGGKFVTKESLLYHTRIHTGERPYKCDLCDKRFLSTSRRAEHIRRHHRAPTLECEICHSKFKERSSLTKHKKRHFNPKSRLHCSKKETEDDGI